jgi:hypothetical protein
MVCVGVRHRNRLSGGARRACHAHRCTQGNQGRGVSRWSDAGFGEGGIIAAREEWTSCLRLPQLARCRSGGGSCRGGPDQRRPGLRGDPSGGRRLPRSGLRRVRTGDALRHRDRDGWPGLNQPPLSLDGALPRGDGSAPTTPCDKYNAALWVLNPHPGDPRAGPHPRSATPDPGGANHHDHEAPAAIYVYTAKPSTCPSLLRRQIRHGVERADHGRAVQPAA